VRKDLFVFYVFDTKVFILKVFLLFLQVEAG